MSTVEETRPASASAELRPTGATVAVLIPCFNEEAAIATVVTEFRAALPEAEIYVYDNNSTDATMERALAAGAVVRTEARQGKGNVVRRMFADVDADVYVMVDGDNTYDAATARVMVDMLIDRRLDMVVAARVPVGGDAHRRGHTVGNAAFTRLLKLLFGGGFTDVFSGYRAMSRRFVKSFPVRSDGFEIETELSAHAQEIVASVAEVPSAYGAREAGAESKLHTVRDGARILVTALRLFENMRPLQFFGIMFLLLSALALALGIPVVNEYVETGLVLRFPTAILAAAIQTVAFISLTAGLILKSVRSTRQEARRLAYLRYDPPSPRRTHG
jgi:glycosyltransferase involved in cell wall biosynthesis